MFKTFFTTTFRHLWRYRLFTTLNIVGLAVSICAGWIIFSIVSYEFSYEKHIPDKEKIYRVISGFNWDGKDSYNGGVSAPLYQSVRSEVTGVDDVVPVFRQWMNAVLINQPGKKPQTIDEPENICAVDASYFKLIPYKWLAGSESDALSTPQSVVLTESRAQKYFPGKKPDEILHKSVTYYSFKDTVQRTIAGVVAELQQPTEFDGQEFLPLKNETYSLNSWTNTNGSDKLYLKIKEGVAPAIVLKQIEDIVGQKEKQFKQEYSPDYKMKRWFELMPLSESHFVGYINEGYAKASKPVMYGLMGIAMLLLVLACINYVNMSVAAIPKRAKEIGVRKTLGSSRTRLLKQFLGETFLTTLVACVLALSFSKIGFDLAKPIIPEGVNLFENYWSLIGFSVVMIFSITFLGGLYPGWLITRVKAVEIFKGGMLNIGSRKFNLQKGLIVFQFVIALVFITSALIVGKQLQYSLKSDLGFNKDAVVLVTIPWKYRIDPQYESKQIPLLNELKKIPGISGISLGDPPMTDGYSSSQYSYKEEGKEPVSFQVYKKNADTGYLRLYDIPLIAGRNLMPSDTAREFLINETAMRDFGFKSPQDALGKVIGQEKERFPIVGVFKDFHAQDFYTKINPMAIMSDLSSVNGFNIKLNHHQSSEWPSIIKKIEKKWSEFYPPETFSYKFYDETIAKIYEKEQNLALLINIATIIAILISCLGLFGLVSLSAYQRTKEIGIRKVLGASVGGILQMFSKEYILLILGAMVIATPIAWWAMNHWLQNFVYRISLSWWLFAIAGAIAIVLAVMTICFQAVKAAIANPVDSLRTE